MSTRSTRSAPAVDSNYGAVDGLPAPVLLSLLGMGGGAVLSRHTGSPVRDNLRGALKGLLTALGGYGGHLAGGSLSESMGTPAADRGFLATTAPIAAGAYGGHQVAGGLARLTGLEPEEPEDELDKQGVLKDAASPVVSALRTAKQESDRRNYVAKHRILRALLRQYPDQFQIDSRQGDIVGLTHNSGFRLHAPAHVLPPPPPEPAVPTELELA